MLRNISSIRSEGNVLPQPAMTVHNFTFDRGDVIVVEVTPAHFPPVRYKGTIWLRIGPRRAIANEMEERMLIEKRTSNITTFDEFPMAQTTIDDLNLVRFKLDYLPKAIAQNTLRDDDRDAKLQLASLRFYDMRSDCPTVAGILTFGKNVRYFFPMAYVQYVKFGGTKVSSPILAENQFVGDLISVVDDLERFVRNNIVEKRPVPVSALREKLVYNYPQWAIREFLMNALMHRSYEITAPVKFYQYADRIEIINPGGLYGNARPENFPNVSDYRNLILSEAMRVMGFVNRFNRGIATAQMELAENGNHPAEFDVNTFGTFGVTIWENDKVENGAINDDFGAIKVENGAIKSESGAINDEKKVKNGAINDENGAIKTKFGAINEKFGDEYFSRQVLQIIHENEGIKIDEICRLTQKPKRTIERWLNRLKKQRVIEYIGALKTGGYRINVFGVIFLEKSENNVGKNDFNVAASSRKMSKNKEGILTLIKENPHITNMEIAKILSMSDRNVRRIVTELSSEEKIIRKGTQKSGFWFISENN
jgi:ATP-dependent DNA helicase RecG